MQNWIANWFHSSNVSRDEHEKYVQFASFAIWQIWKLRCSVVFDNGTIQIASFVRQVNKDITEWTENSRKCRSTITFVNQTRDVLPWKMPENGFDKINFHAAFLKENNYMGLGLMLFFAAEQFGGDQSVAGIAQDEDKAEALATLAAIKWAKDSAVERLHLEGDCQNVVKAINVK
ncbi:uncharacterized protein LOC113315488 [Papaver somniferum]|uniref:uncharacterized protein LOC113315488 n=1 Tax=Papaver somniferum TaxID=3469 RepID=UPI000E6F5E46|nr:uncharacterized protein LOC113315488 [Papaver somniferum]